ncbi:MAG: hypothetical protein KKC99_10020 [Proteobacteria bacterium]|nr:hypothetical protein [Pseudomonadota bacterium]
MQYQRKSALFVDFDNIYLTLKNRARNIATAFVENVYFLCGTALSFLTAMS